MSGTSGRLFRSNLSMVRPLIGALRGDLRAQRKPHAEERCKQRVSKHGHPSRRPLRGLLRVRDIDIQSGVSCGEKADEAGCDRAWRRGRGARGRSRARVVRASSAGPHRAKRHDAADRQGRPRALPHRRCSAHSVVRHRLANARHDAGQCLRRGDRGRPRGGDRCRARRLGAARRRQYPRRQDRHRAPHASPFRPYRRSRRGRDAKLARRAQSSASRSMDRRRRKPPSASPTQRARPSASPAPRRW